MNYKANFFFLVKIKLHLLQGTGQDRILLSARLAAFHFAAVNKLTSTLNLSVMLHYFNF